MILDNQGRPINDDIWKLRDHFSYESEFSSTSNLRETTDAIIRLLPTLSDDEARGVISDMLIIANGQAAGPKKKYYAVNILDRAKSLFPAEYRETKEYHGY